MDKQNVIFIHMHSGAHTHTHTHTHNGISFSLKNEGILIHYNMGET